LTVAHPSPVPVPPPGPELEIERVLRHASVARAAADQQGAQNGELKPPRKRVEVILECALRLFNQFGVASISTNRISAELGISPGNVHYHYRSKANLLEAAFQVMDGELREVFARPTAVLSVAEFVDWQTNKQRVLWRYRYFFGSLEVVLRTAPELRIPWLKLQSELVHQLVSTHEYYVQAHLMTAPKPPNTIPQVAQNSLMLSMSWIRWEFLALDGALPTEQEEREIIHRLVLHHLSFYGPYHTRSQRGSEMLEHVLREKFPTK
jgi:AcrR family transcriptional regulator